MRRTTRGSLSCCAWRRSFSSLEMVILLPLANVGCLSPNDGSFFWQCRIIYARLYSYPLIFLQRQHAQTGLATTRGVAPNCCSEVIQLHISADLSVWCFASVLRSRGDSIAIGWSRRCIDTTYRSPTPRTRIPPTRGRSRQHWGLQDRTPFHTECLVFRRPSYASLPVHVS